MPNFNIENYTVTRTSRVNGTETILELSSAPLAHGIRHGARIFFVEEPVRWIGVNDQAIGVATNVGAPNFNGESIYAWLPIPEFTQFYDLVRSESPLTFDHTRVNINAEPNGTTKFVTSLGIGTGDEFPGEGFSDPDALLPQ